MRFVVFLLCGLLFDVLRLSLMCGYGYGVGKTTDTQRCGRSEYACCSRVCTGCAIALRASPATAVRDYVRDWVAFVRVVLCVLNLPRNYVRTCLRLLDLLRVWN